MADALRFFHRLLVHGGFGVEDLGRLMEMTLETLKVGSKGRSGLFGKFEALGIQLPSEKVFNLLKTPQFLPS